MSMDRGSHREGRGCVRAHRRQSTVTHEEMEDGSEDASRAKELGAWLALVPGHWATTLEVLGCCGSRPKVK